LKDKTIWDNVEKLGKEVENRDHIKEGVVIDHIPKNKALGVCKLLDLEESATVSIEMNQFSEKTKSKDIIRIQNSKITDKEIRKIAVIAPEAVISLVHDFKVYNKGKIRIPKLFENILVCNNTSCISRSSSMEISKFKLVTKEPLKLECYYCGSFLTREELRFRE
jgi:aspartate carbamoyltransferase regulatory subunit